MTYVVAADGGNSKTDVVLAGVDGSVVARVRAAGTRPHVDGMPAMAASLAAAVRAATDSAGVASVAAGVFYLANIDLPSDEVAAVDALCELDVASHVVVRNDVFAILRAGAPRGWGVAVTSGAGINAIGVDPSGREERFLAIGDISGDWGGGYSLGTAALGAAVRSADGRGPATGLRRTVLDTFGVEAEEAALAINRGSLARDALRDLAPAVLDAADAGDAVAAGIVLRLADEVTAMATALLRRLELSGSDADVVLGGSILQAGNRTLLDGIRVRVGVAEPYATVRVLDAPPVAGALAAALELAGAPAAAQQRAREQLSAVA